MNPFNVNSVSGYDMSNIKNIYQMMMNSRNPMQVFEQMANQNPNLRPIVNALRNGANPQSLFNEMCKQRGISLDQLKHMFGIN